MDPVDDIAEKHARNRQRRIEQVKAWADYVRTHPDEEWGEQLNRLVNAQVEAARHHEGERPDPAELEESPLLDDEREPPLPDDERGPPLLDDERE